MREDDEMGIMVRGSTAWLVLKNFVTLDWVLWELVKVGNWLHSSTEERKFNTLMNRYTECHVTLWLKQQYKNNYNETIWVSINFAFYGRAFNQFKKKVNHHVICPEWISKRRCRITSILVVFNLFAHSIVFLSINTFQFELITVQ
jgi:hypothetical protein